MNAMKLVGVLLAAGASRRFGADKLLARLPGGTPVAVAALRSLSPAVDEVVAVVREPGELTRVLSGAGARVVPFPGAERGMGASLAQGVRAAAGADGWLVALADMPFVTLETVAAVAALLRAGAPLAAPRVGGRRGHPVGFSGAFRDRLAALDGDEGARAILAAESARIVFHDCDDPGVLRDIDRVSDLPPGFPGRRGDI